MAHLVAQQCRPLAIWNDSGLELPESGDVVRETCRQLGLELAIAKGDALGIKLRKGRTKAEATAIHTDMHAIINPVRDLLDQRGITCNFVGLRIDESRVRKIAIFKNGAVHESKRWGRGVAWPMRRWTASDCYAYMDAHGLPVHPAYSRTLWAHGDRNKIRVSWVWDSTRETQGDLEYLKHFYPRLFARLRQLGAFDWR